MIIENLTILEQYLLTIPGDEFDMRTFARMDSDYEIPLRAHECKTAGCAIGWGPSAGLAILDTDEGWSGYGERITGLDHGSRAWSWCFAGTWAYVDNTAVGAAKRIRHLIDHGIPHDSYQQMFARVPYLFREAA